MNDDDLKNLPGKPDSEIEAMAEEEARRLRELPDSEMFDELMKTIGKVADVGGFDVGSMQRCTMLVKILTDKRSDPECVESFQLGEQGLSMFMNVIGSFVEDFYESNSSENPTMVGSALILMGIAAGIEWKEYLRA